MSRRSSALRSLPLARRTRGTKVSPACFGSGAVVEELSRFHPRREGKPERGRHRGLQPATGPVRLVGSLLYGAPSPFSWGHTPLRLWSGPHHLMFRSSSGAPPSRRQDPASSEGISRACAAPRRSSFSPLPGAPGAPQGYLRLASGQVPLRSFSPRSTHEGRRGARREEGIAGSSPPPARQVSRLSATWHPPHIFWDCTPLRPRSGPQHTMFYFLSSGPRVTPGYSGHHERPARDCGPPPHHAARDLGASSPAVHHVGCGLHFSVCVFFLAGWGQYLVVLSCSMRQWSVWSHFQSRDGIG
ncbi:hypothetical protein NDU88_001802 [Pleurodeles waltl]|uniref:Uncharacterized protein n=1 Tax=Pleurodeles waltl TaxID=8319 RepID=A0AAV7SD71_PLEWA|nr:hypothetical protein NDU88_001802 [Pleurodeles waltl]